MLASFVSLVIYLIVVGIIFGLLLYLLSISPVPEPWKGWIHFLIIAAGIIIVIFVLLGMVAGGVGSVKMPRFGLLSYPMLT